MTVKVMIKSFLFTSEFHLRIKQAEFHTWITFIKFMKFIYLFVKFGKHIWIQRQNMLILKFHLGMEYLRDFFFFFSSQDEVFTRLFFFFSSWDEVFTRHFFFFFISVWSIYTSFLLFFHLGMKYLHVFSFFFSPGIDPV